MLRDSQQLGRVNRPGSHHSGEVLAGRYTLIRPLCRGGMGVVWVARSKPLDVLVALKVLPEPIPDPSDVERMSREARAAARLGHPAIVRVFDFGITDGMQPFMAMELLTGENLYSVLQERVKVPSSEAVSLLLPIIDGLVVAHQAGIVHRDIKPENVFLARDDLGRTQPKLLDFGIALLESDRVSRLTDAGTFLGTPQYLSPEQAYGREDIDFRADIWSLGVVLYELVTGTEPFTGRSYNAVIRSIIEDEPDPAPIFAAGDEALWHIIQRCLSKDPNERWDSTWALGQALAGWLIHRGIEADASSRALRDAWRLDRDSAPGHAVRAPKTRSHRSEGVAVGGALVLVALLAYAAAQFKPSRAELPLSPGASSSSPLAVAESTSRPEGDPIVRKQTATEPAGVPSGRPHSQRSVHEHERRRSPKEAAVDPVFGF